ncbi:MAG: 30S ribosomal protein S6 [Firmicutes bacterium]|nr:30S ribosomal protein S6 [Bacillota bacterium]
MNKYELLYIIESKLEDAKREKEIEKVSAFIKKSGGEVEQVTKTAPWGLKKLAYPIDYKKEGFYVLVHFSSLAEKIADLERQLKLSDNVMRYKVINRHA